MHVLDGSSLPGIIALDWAVPNSNTPSSSSSPSSPYTATTPTVLLFHGLTGGSSENYIQVTISHLLDAGFRCVVMNARGCGGSPLHTAQSFCAAYTDDVRQVRYSITPSAARSSGQSIDHTEEMHNTI